MELVLCCGGRLLCDNNRQLQSYGICSHSTIEVTVRMKGGGVTADKEIPGDTEQRFRKLKEGVESALAAKNASLVEYILDSMLQKTTSDFRLLIRFSNWILTAPGDIRNELLTLYLGGGVSSSSSMDSVEMLKAILSAPIMMSLAKAEDLESKFSSDDILCTGLAQTINQIGERDF